MTKAEIKLAKANRYTNPEQFEIVKNRLIEEKISKKYTIYQEISILRQRDTKTYEFAEYNSFVESCKAEAKKELGI